MKRARNRKDDPLSRRERQIMDIIYEGGELRVHEIMERLPDPPTNATVRTILRVLEEKGEVKHRKGGRSFLYSPTRSRGTVARSALRRLLDTFYDGSVESAVSGLLKLENGSLDDDELDRIEQLIKDHKHHKPTNK